MSITIERRVTHMGVNINSKLEKGILDAMSITTYDIRPDFEDTFSKTNHNGIHQVVWAKRSQYLKDIFENDPNIEVLDIQRNFWKVNPVFDIQTGNLYILVSDNNLQRKIADYKSKGTSTHYIYELLIKNDQLEAPQNELSLFSNENYDEKEQRHLYSMKMLGDNYDNVKQVILISVSYFNEAAIGANKLLYNDKFDLILEENLSSLLHNEAPIIDSNNNPNEHNSVEETYDDKPLVTLKKKYQRKKPGD